MEETGRSFFLYVCASLKKKNEWETHKELGTKTKKEIWGERYLEPSEDFRSSQKKIFFKFI
jgi:hypothetical protein